MTAILAPEVKVYILAEQEIHMIGEYVGLCWRLRTAKKRMVNPADGLFYEAKIQEREGNPYLLFCSIREYVDGPYRDEDSPVDGGFGPEQAEQIARELRWALAYMEKMGLYKSHVTRES